VNDRADSGIARGERPPAARPYNVRDVVKWGDCDPAGIIYTPRVLDFAMQALEAWNRDVLGVSWLRLNREHGMGAPTVRAEIDFLAAPAPDQALVTEVRVRKVGRSSITYELTGRSDEGLVYYRAILVACFIERPAFKAAPIPEPFRSRALAYQKDCGDA